MTYFIDSTYPGYRDYCAKIVQARARFSQEERNQIALEFLRKGLDAKEVAARYHLSSAHILYQWVGRYIEETQIMRQSHDGMDDEFKAMSPQEQLRELKRLKRALELEKIRSEAFKHMIEVAEQQFNIPIRKKIWHQTVSWLHGIYPHIGLGKCCALFGYSRQSYYQHANESDFSQQALRELIVQTVRTYREQMPRLGSRKLYILIKQNFGSQAGLPGRDKFVDLLSEQGLLLRIKRRKRYRTTDSEHPFKRYPNLIRDKVFTAPNQAWVSDITYVETRDGVCYLSLITDLYSRKIVGWALGKTLQTIHCRSALQMALQSLSYPQDSRGLIRHSDRGCQYCSFDYVNELKSRGMRISMTESGDPLENAVAERVNGIIKSEWLYGVDIKNYEDCRGRVSRAIKAYNDLRPHMSLDYQTPSEVHDQGATPKRHWKTFRERNQARQG